MNDAVPKFLAIMPIAPGPSLVRDRSFAPIAFGGNLLTRQSSPRNAINVTIVKPH
jgi:hypothetical protein